MAEKVRTISCACGSIQYEVKGEPILSFNCYCDDCQKATGSTGVSAALFPKAQTKNIKGQDMLETFVLRTLPRNGCKKCHNFILLTNQSLPDVLGFNGNLLPGYVPQFHQQLKFSTVKILDDKPKYAGVNPNFGGSSEIIDWAKPSRKATVTRYINKEPRGVWRVIGDWSKAGDLPVKLEGPAGVGQVREFKVDAGIIRQKLLAKDDINLKVVLTIISHPTIPYVVGAPAWFELQAAGEGETILTYGLDTTKMTETQHKEVLKTLDKAIAMYERAIKLL